VPLTSPFFVAARAQGIEIVGDVELFARAVQGQADVAGITGTNGKSTVTTLVGRMAERASRSVRTGGNLGEPALDLLVPEHSRRPADLHVLELSSFQLETTASLALAAATLLNLTPDHLDRHGSMAAYGAAKARIFAHARAAVISLDDPVVPSLVPPGLPTLRFSLRPGQRCEYGLAEGWLIVRGKPVLAVAQMKIQGLHNVANALAALATGEALSLALPAMLDALIDFPGLPHRSEWVAERAGVTYINDSKGTNVGATIAAVQGLKGPLQVIAGGDGKGQDFGPLAEGFRAKVRHTLLIGRDAPALAAALDGVCEISRCASLEEAVVMAARAARPGDTVLLSPACASLDMFRDYTHRGAVFIRAVQELPS
jgi:UDP-N-acetylmuramoylalanine--D-glutamate ligase